MDHDPVGVDEHIRTAANALKNQHFDVVLKACDKVFGGNAGEEDKQRMFEAMNKLVHDLKPQEIRGRFRCDVAAAVKKYDIKKAALLWSYAFNTDRYARAAVHLGIRHQEGKNSVKAKEWFKKGYDMGDPKAALCLAQLLPDDQEELRKECCEKALRDGDWATRAQTGLLYRKLGRHDDAGVALAEALPEGKRSATSMSAEDTAILAEAANSLAELWGERGSQCELELETILRLARDAGRLARDARCKVASGKLGMVLARRKGLEAVDIALELHRSGCSPEAVAVLKEVHQHGKCENAKALAAFHLMFAGRVECKPTTAHSLREQLDAHLGSDMQGTDTNGIVQLALSLKESFPDDAVVDEQVRNLLQTAHEKGSFRATVQLADHLRASEREDARFAGLLAKLLQKQGAVATDFIEKYLGAGGEANKRWLVDKAILDFHQTSDDRFILLEYDNYHEPFVTTLAEAEELRGIRDALAEVGISWQQPPDKQRNRHHVKFFTTPAQYEFASFCLEQYQIENCKPDSLGNFPTSRRSHLPMTAGHIVVSARYQNVVEEVIRRSGAARLKGDGKPLKPPPFAVDIEDGLSKVTWTTTPIHSRFHPRKAMKLAKSKLVDAHSTLTARPLKNKKGEN